MWENEIGMWKLNCPYSTSYISRKRHQGGKSTELFACLKRAVCLIKGFFARKRLDDDGKWKYFACFSNFFSSSKRSSLLAEQRRSNRRCALSLNEDRKCLLRKYEAHALHTHPRSCLPPPILEEEETSLTNYRGGGERAKLCQSQAFQQG